jgi:hypothetical protein
MYILTLTCSVSQILTALNARLAPEVFSTPLLSSLLALLGPPNSAALKSLPADQRDREEKERVTKQRGVLRVLAEAEACGLRLVQGTTASNGRKSKATVPEEPVVGMGWCVEEGLRGLVSKSQSSQYGGHGRSAVGYDRLGLVRRADRFCLDLFR